MRPFPIRPLLAPLMALAVASPAVAQYGDIGGLKVAKPEDGRDVESLSPPPGSVVIFDGKSLDQLARSEGDGPATWKLVDGGAMEVRGGGVVSKRKFDGHFKLHLEFRVPYMPQAKGQARGNSGVYVQGRYEVQILDSYGLDSLDNDCGGIYKVAKPLVNACKAPTVWQSYDIDFKSPVCKGGKRAEPARITVKQNGRTIHDDVAINVDETYVSLGGDPCSPGPIYLQDHGNPVQYRNIWVHPLP